VAVAWQAKQSNATDAIDLGPNARSRSMHHHQTGKVAQIASERRLIKLLLPPSIQIIAPKKQGTS
jgi:hypothetical protein